MPPIHLEGVTKRYDKHGPLAVDHVSLDIEDGEFMVLVGPSGCGKSTLLRMIAGIEETSGGTISIGDRDVTHLDPRKRDIAMVFQSYALYPHLTVRGNLGFGLKLHGASKSEIAARVEEVAKTIGLDELLDRRPGELSGGQRQRVAMGRAIARQPQAFLMDEPLSNLDAKLRVSMRSQLSQLHDRLGVTTVYVTHDQVEAMTLGQRVAVMRSGVLQQCASPTELFHRPANLFVAAFIGSPSMNLVEARVADGALAFAGQRVALSAASGIVAPVAGGRVVLGLRPHDLELCGPGLEDTRARLRARVDVVEDLGTEKHLIFKLDAPRVSADELREAMDAEDDAVLLADEDRAVWTAVVDPRCDVRPGETVELGFDPARLHGFDPDSGAALRTPAAAAAPASAAAKPVLA
ncbi:MAG TPA: ABC transporter ATP-binding protein [Solirubrobacteraceae bacterium]|nr:ABC transporter ATP-binding protein [Solirubrobacteraceae bacterium]